MERPFPAYDGDEPYVFVCYSHEDPEIVYPEPDHLAAGAARCEAEQELDAVPVGEDGVGADVALRSKVRLEEAAEQRRQRGLGAHDAPPDGRTSRAKAWKRVLACSSRAVVIRK